MNNNLACEKCRLFEGCKTPNMQPDIVYGTIGPHDIDVMFAGESPGADEDRQGKPFVGRSGQLLRDAVKEVGLQHSNLMYTNVVRCRPPGNKITARAIKYCTPNLLSEIEQYDPRMIILLGNTPLKAVLGESGITNWRGTLIERDGRAYLPVFHPAYILRNNTALPQWVDDLDKAYAWLSGEESTRDVSKGYELKIVANERDAKAMYKAIKHAKVCAWDTEVNGLRFGDELVLMSFATMYKAWAVLLENDQVINICQNILTDPEIYKVGHNIKFDCLVVKGNWDVNVQGIVGDSMLLSYILDSVPGRHGLKPLAGRHLGMYDYDREFREYLAKHLEASPAKGGDLHKVPLEILAQYAQLDAIATIQLHEKLAGELTNDNQRTLYRELMIPASRALTHLEANGVLLDDCIVRRYTKIYGKVQQDQLRVLKADKHVRHYEATRLGKDKKYTGFNPNSPDQMREVLFSARYYGLKSLGMTDTGKPSTRWDYLKVYKDDIPFVADYRYYKLLGKMLSTYLKPAKERWIDKDGRCRSSYLLHGTETGRLSSRQPNLQNIPTPEKEPGTLLATLPIKNIFTHTWEGGCILAVDYSGMELRTMASVSGCKGMLEAFENDVDVHSYVTELLYGIKREDYSDEEWKPKRYRAKWVNWTLLYGGSYYTLHNLYGINKTESQRLVDAYYGAFPEVLDYKEQTLAFARKHGYVESKFGRRRYMPYINDNNDRRRRADERAAINMPIQSAASDMLLCSLIVLDDLMGEAGFKSLMVNTVHDSIMFDAYPDELDELAWLCTDVMEKLPQTYGLEWFPGLDFSWFVAPLKVDLEVGSHYGCMEHYVLEEQR